MATNFLTKIFGSRNDRLLKQYRKTVEQINSPSRSLNSPSDEQPKAKTQEFRDRWAKGRRWTTCCPKPSGGGARGLQARHEDARYFDAGS